MAFLTDTVGKYVVAYPSEVPSVSSTGELIEFVSVDEKQYEQPSSDLVMFESVPTEPVDIYLSDVDKILDFLENIGCASVSYISRSTGVPVDVIHQVVSRLPDVVVRSGYVLCGYNGVKRLQRVLGKVSTV